MSESNNHGHDVFEKVLIAGLAFLGGVAVGMLFAPKSGKENRQWVKSQAGKIKDSAINLGKKAEDKLNDMRDKMSGEKVHSNYPDEKEIYNEGHKS